MQYVDTLRDAMSSASVQYRADRVPSVPYMVSGPPLARVAARVVMGPNGCWIWTGGLIANSGYGQLGGTRGEPSKVAHVVAYEALVGPIPDGLQLDHLCHTRDGTCPGGKACLHRRCINPDHLEPVTSKVNNLRSATCITTINATKDRCVNDHAFTPENTRVTVAANGSEHRTCMTCHRNQSADRRARIRAAGKAA